MTAWGWARARAGASWARVGLGVGRGAEHLAGAWGSSSGAWRALWANVCSIVRSGEHW
jgi:hypothetical protein